MFKIEQVWSSTKIVVDVYQQKLKQQKVQSLDKGVIDESNAFKSSTIKSSLKKSCVRTSCAVYAQAKSATLSKDVGGEMSRMLCSML